MGEVIDFAARRAELAARRERRLEEDFDRELRRRLGAFLDGEPVPAGPAMDAPYR